MPSNAPTLADVIAQVEAWQNARVEEAAAFSLRGFSSFVEQMNFRSRNMISLFDRKDPDFYSALAELATQAQVFTANRKVFADGKDVTNQ